MTDIEKYQVKVKADHGKAYLSVTHNGYQWNSINLNYPEYEIPLIISALNRYLDDIAYLG